MTSIDWSAAKADDFRIPEGHPRAELITELAQMLRSPDPGTRDTLGFFTLATWIGRGDLTPELATDLGDRMAERLTDPEVQARTFAPLILCCLAEQDVVDQRWVTAFEQWYAAELDLRGHDPALGWLHAVAHGADLLGELGRASTVDASRMLRLAASRLTAPTEHVWRDQEDDRLALAIAQTLTRDGLTPAEATGWLDAVETMLTTGEEGPVPPHVSNTLRTLRSLYVVLDTGVRVRGQELPLIPAHAPAIKARLVEVLHHATPWMW